MTLGLLAQAQDVRAALTALIMARQQARVQTSAAIFKTKNKYSLRTEITATLHA